MTDLLKSKRLSEQILETEEPPKKKISSDEPLDHSKSLANDESPDSLDLEAEDTFTRATEVDVGITEYVSDLPGFFAVMKQRYSDFLVNEVDLQGQLVKLTDISKPKNLTDTHEIRTVLKEEIIAKLHALSDCKETEVLIEVTDEDKNYRKKIHEVIRQNFRGIESLTVDKDAKKFIVAKKQNQKFKGRRFQPSPAGNYLHFVMYKENRDTMNTISTIASYLRIPTKTFSYAGTKDKRAKTSQLVSAYRLSAEKLLSVNGRFNKIKVGNLTFKKEQLHLGDLLGNYFTIILRQLDGELEVIEKSMKSLASNGFINYYGLQRFGTLSVPTHTIGRALLLGDWKNAINLILRPSLEGDANVDNLHKSEEKINDAKKAFTNSKNKYIIEQKLLHGLSSNNENDLVGALNAIPRNTRLMYIHSYQSFVWNRVVSERIKTHGLKVLPGDLISNNSEEILEVPPDVEKSERRRTQLANEVKFVSEEDIQKTSIKDVLLPLPGHSVLYPKNECKEWYEAFLKKDGIDWSNFESNVKTYSLSGDYRKMVVVPSEIKWEIIPYEDACEPLVLSDLDILQHHKAINPISTGSKKALKVEFKLPSSCYATMAVREILKCSTAYSSKQTK